MNTRDKMTLDPSLESERSFEELLGRAAKRPAPPAGDIEAARAAVRAEWRSATQKHRRRRWLAYAAAATIVVAVAGLVDLARSPLPDPVSVATIDRSNGAIYLLGEQSELRQLEDIGTIMAGETIETGREASLGISWGSGGSLRVDEQTRVLFADRDVVELVRGRVYFDSSGTTGEPLVIRTRHGQVAHVGTQYMVDVDGPSLAVSVREGSVAIEGRFHDAVADAGERLTFRDSRPPRVEAISRYGGDWRWVEATAPIVAFDGRRVIELVDWVARETGLDVEFSDAAVAASVEREVLSGRFDARPRVALRQGLLAVGLAHRLDDGTIFIFDAETGDD